MRRIAGLLSAAAIIFGITAAAQAYTPVTGQNKVMIASVTFSGSGIVQMSASVVNPDAAGRIWWDTSNNKIVPSVTEWKVAESYIQFNSTLTQAGSGIHIYTDNKTAAHPYVGIANPAGLVGYDPGDPSASSTTLAMCWRVVDITTNTLTIVKGNDNKLYSQDLGGETSDWPVFLYMTDKGTKEDDTTNTQAFDSALGQIYRTVAKPGLFQGAEGSWYQFTSPNYIYIGANFKEAVTPRSYQTNRIILEAFTQ